MCFETFIILSLLFVTSLIFVCYYLISSLDRKYQIKLLELEHSFDTTTNSHWQEYMELRREIYDLKDRPMACTGGK